MFVFIDGGRALFKLHAAGQPLLGIVVEAIAVAALYSLFNYTRKHGE
jgi:hypothetical protein